MPADMGGKSPLRDGSNEESILAKIKQISSLLQFKTCAPALTKLRRDGLGPQQLALPRCWHSHYRLGIKFFWFSPIRL
jgi:hypothetical protein